MRKQKLQSLDDRGPLRTMFVLTNMPVGGAETLLDNLVRRFDREHIIPEICCLKEKGELGEVVARDVPVHDHLLKGKFDIRVVWRLVRLLKKRRMDALVTVGAGDKMFWGRLAARLAGLPVIASALHSTGWPDGVGRLNRRLTPITDAFIAVARDHQRFLIEYERFPAERVSLIPNGVDTQKFRRIKDSQTTRRKFDIPDSAPVVGIIAALRPEKNHALFLEMAKRVLVHVPQTHFMIVGDGPERPQLEWLSREKGVANQVRFCGTQQDVPAMLSAMDIFALSSRNEANPVSILEAMSIGLPVVSTDVGSIHETVHDDVTGFLVPSGDADALAVRIGELLFDPVLATKYGERGRQVVVADWSLDAMVRGYEKLIAGIYARKAGGTLAVPTAAEALSAGETPRYDKLQDTSQPTR